MHITKSSLLLLAASTATHARELGFTHPATFYEFDDGPIEVMTLAAESVMTGMR